MIPGTGIKVEIAFATAPDSTTPTWVDVTTYVMMNPGIIIGRGRAPEGGRVQASTLTLTLKNDDGRFTAENPSSPYYPNVKLHRRIRVSWVNPVGGATFVRWVGFIGEWPVSWPGPNVSRVTIVATDRFKRLGRLRTLASVVTEAIMADSPRAYFPCNEPKDSVSAGDLSLAGVSTPLTIRQYGSGGAVVFGEGTGPAVDAASAVMFQRASGSSGKSLVASAVGGYNASTTSFSFEFTFATTTITQRLIEFTSAHGESVFVEIDATGNIALGTQVAGSLPGKVSSAATYIDGATRHVLVTVTSGGNCVLKVNNSTVVTFATSASWATAVPTFTELELGGSSPVMANATISHLVVVTPGHSTAILTGFAGERSDQRISRLLGWAGVIAGQMSLDVGSSTNIEHFDTTGLTAIEAAQKVADTEGGPLFIDRATGNVVMHSRSRRYSPTATLSVTASQVRPGPTFTIDDAELANDVTGKHGSGAAYRTTDPASIADHGYATDELDLVTASDAEVADIVNWQVATRSQPKRKTPQLAIDLLDDTVRVSALALDISSRLQVTALPSQLGTSSVDFFVEGYTETISDQAWDLSLNTSSLQRYGDVWKVGDATYGAIDSGHLIGY